MRASVSLLPTVMRRFVDRPLALLPSHATLILDALQGGNLAGLALSEAIADNRPYDVVNGVAVIVVSGILVHERTWFWGETDYASISKAIVAAVQDAEVEAIVLLVKSPGGEVAGCFDLADGIYGLRGIKPIWAILDEYAYSAAYALACAADRIIVPRTGGTGSIGVITMHMDVTKMLEQWGVKVTTIQFGARKSDSYPTTPLSDEARASLQADCDVMGGMFVDLVARNRGLSATKVRGTEAACFLGAAGVEQGLADAVMAPDAAFLSLLDTLR